MKELLPGQVFRLVKHDKYSNVGYEGDLAILLSVDSKNGIDLYKIGVFWWSGKGKDCGGARVMDFHEDTIKDIFKYVGFIKDLKGAK